MYVLIPGRMAGWRLRVCADGEDGGNDEFATLPWSIPAVQRRHLEDGMVLDLFAGIPVTDYAAALPWYEQFSGGRPSFLPSDTEAVWEVAEHRYIYIVRLRCVAAVVGVSRMLEDALNVPQVVVAVVRVVTCDVLRAQDAHGVVLQDRAGV